MMARAKRRKAGAERQRAIDRGYPEAIVPEVVQAWYKGKHKEINDLRTIIGQGYRYSPKAMRSMTLALANGIYTDTGKGYYGPPNQQFRHNVASYAYFNDFITYEEYVQLVRDGKALRSNLPQEEFELWSGPDAPFIHNSVHPTMEGVGAILEERRRQNPNIKVALFDGKFNGIPHPGYFILFSSAVERLMNQEKIRPENLIFVVACANNNYISQTGSMPFLDTVSRMSLMSYLPWIDYVCHSGEYTLDTALTHWIYKIQNIAPDYYMIENDHPLKDKKIFQAITAGAKILTHGRAGIDFPTEIGSSLKRRFPGPEISSGGILAGTVGIESEISYSNPYARLFAIKNARDMQYGKRDWFGG